MITAHTVTAASYQWQLRALGAFLDAQPAADVSIMEVGDRYAVRYYDARRDHSSPVFVFMDVQQLQRINDALLERRERGASGQHGFEPDGRYQDLLRALGWELDDLDANQIVMDERTEGLYVSYRYTSPDGELFRKRIANLGVPDWEAILHEARSRRGRG